jgi:hypothetical protein
VTHSLGAVAVDRGKGNPNVGVSEGRILDLSQDSDHRINNLLD